MEWTSISGMHGVLFMTCSLLVSFGIYEFLEPEMRAEIAIFSHLT